MSGFFFLDWSFPVIPPTVFFSPSDDFPIFFSVKSEEPEVEGIPRLVQIHGLNDVAKSIPPTPWNSHFVRVVKSGEAKTKNKYNLKKHLRPRTRVSEMFMKYRSASRSKYQEKAYLGADKTSKKQTTRGV